MTETIQPSICRLCTAYCPILVTLEDGKAIKVTGNPNAPLYGGYICPKGRALPEQHYGDARLIHSYQRGESGLEVVDTGKAMDQIAERLQAIIAEHGPRSVAIYSGMGSVPFIAAPPIAMGWLKAIGSSMFFTAGSIDKPGILIALAMHGMWQAGQPRMETADAWLFVGINPVISKSPGFPGQNPGQMLKKMTQRDAKLIVIDPRRTETAKRAHIHLQCRPGEDPTLLAGLIHVILDEDLYDADFVAANAKGLEELRAAVAPFTPDYVAERAGINAQDLIAAARVFANASYSGVSCGTGPSFATHSTLTEYFALCLATLCGRWAREGQPVSKPNVLLPAYTAKAQPWPAFQGWGFEPRLRVKGLGGCVSGLSAAALSDEILLEGPGQIKALVVHGGNPMMAWPDQVKAHKALQALDLLVTIDTEMTATAELSDYVIAPALTLETPMTTYMPEGVKYYGTTRGFDQPYAAYTPSLIDPPDGADVIEDWVFFWELAKRMGVTIPVTLRYGNGPQAERPPYSFTLDPSGPKPTTDELLELVHKTSRIPLDRVKQFPNGNIFEDEQRVQARDADNTDRLELAAPLMLEELAAILAEGRVETPDYPMRFIPRRLNNFLNSFGRRMPSLTAKKNHNTAYMHPEDMAGLGIASGDVIMITSPYGEIKAVVEDEDMLRLGMVSLAHGFGGNPGDDDDVFAMGSNTGRLLSSDAEYDPITGIPRMGAVPVRVRLLEHVEAASPAAH